jgi:hypothetical protein
MLLAEAVVRQDEALAARKLDETLDRVRGPPARGIRGLERIRPFEAQGGLLDELDIRDREYVRYLMFRRCVSTVCGLRSSSAAMRFWHCPFVSRSRISRSRAVRP